MYICIHIHARACMCIDKHICVCMSVHVCVCLSCLLFEFADADLGVYANALVYVWIGFCCVYVFV